MSADPELGQFLQAAGRSLGDAQGGLVDGAALPTNVAISEVDLEVKTAFTRSSDGALLLQTISASDMREGDIAPELVSTVRARLVTIADDTAAAGQPQRSATDVEAEVRDRPDVTRLADILGRVDVQAVFVAEARRWLVRAEDDQGRILREVILPDTPRS